MTSWGILPFCRLVTSLSVFVGRQPAKCVPDLFRRPGSHLPYKGVTLVEDVERVLVAIFFDTRQVSGVLGPRDWPTQRVGEIVDQFHLGPCRFSTAYKIVSMG